MRRPASRKFSTAWADLLQNAVSEGERGRPAGDGWMTAEEFARDANRSVSTARVLLKQQVALGRLEVQRALIDRAWVRFYRPKV